MKKVSIDLGCGKAPKNSFNCDVSYGIDINPSLASSVIKIADLAIESIPFPDRYFDVVTAYDFIEHVPRLIYVDGKRLNPFVALMNEISRVLKPGGLFFSSTPAYPHPSAFQDPTHVNIITNKTFINYFSIKHKCLGKIYGYTGELVFLGQHVHNGSHIRATLRKNFTPNSLANSFFYENSSLSMFRKITGPLNLDGE